MSYETHTMKDKRIAGYMDKIGIQNARIEDLESGLWAIKSEVSRGTVTVSQITEYVDKILKGE